MPPPLAGPRIKAQIDRQLIITGRLVSVPITLLDAATGGPQPQAPLQPVIAL